MSIRHLRKEIAHIEDILVAMEEEYRENATPTFYALEELLLDLLQRKKEELESYWKF